MKRANGRTPSPGSGRFGYGFDNRITRCPAVEMTVSGTVKDSKGTAIYGALVSLASDTSVRSMTGADGAFTINKPVSIRGPAAPFPAGAFALFSSDGRKRLERQVGPSETGTLRISLPDLEPGLYHMLLSGDRDAPAADRNGSSLRSMGYSVGGTSAVDIGEHQAVITVVSLHGHASDAVLHGPLMQTSGTKDDVGLPLQQKTFVQSKVRTIFSTVMGASHDLGTGLFAERPAAIAWLRYWLYNDQGARHYSYGDDCVMCKSPWTNPQRKNWQ